MVSQESVDMQLKKIKYNVHGWGRAEVGELKNILLEGEEIYEAVNGLYEGGFAMLLATDVRMILIDKKPLNYLTVEDIRFDTISELDYYHRLFGAHISVASGSRNLKFTSYNQPRLRKLIGHVQHRMADAKKKLSGHQVDQKNHLEQINQQLQAYLLAQHQQQERLHDQLLKNNSSDDKTAPKPEPIRPSNELSDYLYAQSLLTQFNKASGGSPTKLLQDSTVTNNDNSSQAPPSTAGPMAVSATTETATAESEPKPDVQMSELYAEGMQEIFGKQGKPAGTDSSSPVREPNAELKAVNPTLALTNGSIEVSALGIAYSKLPMALRNRRFGRPSFHSHSKATTV